MIGCYDQNWRLQVEGGWSDHPWHTNLHESSAERQSERINAASRSKFASI